MYGVCCTTLLLSILSTCTGVNYCRYNYPQRLQPGTDGLSVSLSVDCDTTPGNALLHWSNGGIPTAALTVHYDCFDANDTSEVEEDAIECLICGNDNSSLYTSSSSITIPASIGTECSFFGCYEGGEGNTWFTFSTQTCIWQSQNPVAATPTPSMSHTTVESTALGGPGVSTTYSGATSERLAETRVPVAETVTLLNTEIALVSSSTLPTSSEQVPGGNTDYPSSVTVLAWLVPVVLFTCITAGIGIVIVTYYSVTRKKTTRRNNVYNEYYGTKMYFQDKPDLTYNPITTSPFTSIQSLESYFDKFDEFRDTQSEQVDGNDLANKSNDTPKDYCAHTDSNSYLNVHEGHNMPASVDTNTTSSDLKAGVPTLQPVKNESLGETGYMQMDAKDKDTMSVDYVSECTYADNNPNLSQRVNCAGYVHTLEDTSLQTPNVEEHFVL